MTSRYGLTMPPDLDPHAEIELAQRAERLGYSDVWNGEVSGADGVASIAAAAVSTTTVRLGTGILNVYSRSAFVLAMAAASLQNLSRGRRTVRPRIAPAARSPASPPATSARADLPGGPRAEDAATGRGDQRRR